MKLCSFTANGKAGYGLVTDAGIVDLGKQFADAPTLRDFIAGGLDRAAKLAGAPADYQLSDVVLEPVIPNPDKIVCVGLNYHDHVKETGREQTPNPALFCRFAGSQVGHEQPMIKPLESDDFDFEGELAVVIGKGGRRIKVEDALDHVAGYSCYNDGSIRDWQRHTIQFTAGKTWAGTGGFGPYLVTTDEVGDYTKHTLETRLNGEVMQHTSLDLMITPVREQIAYISTMLPLLPGDVIVSGTPGGVGMKRNPPVYMKDGDLVEIDISSVGVLRNPIVAEKSA